MRMGMGMDMADVAALQRGDSVPFVFPELQPLIASACMDLDCTNALSYSGSGQTWSNLVAAPADGAAQTAYDYMLGTTTGTEGADPTFSGTAGSRAAEFSVNGSQYFTIKNGNTQLIKDMHKTTGGASWSMVLAGKFIARSGSTFGAALFGNGGTDGTKNGVAFGNGQFGSTNKGVFAASAAQGFNGGVNFSAVADVYDGTYKLIGVTYNPSTKAVKFYNGSNAVATGTATSYTGTGEPTDAMTLLATQGVNIAYNGTKLIAASQFNAILSDTNFTTLRTMYSTRHNRTY